MLHQKRKNAPGSLHCSDISLPEIAVYPFMMPLLSDANITTVMTFVNILIQILDGSNGQTHFNVYVAVVFLAEVWVVVNHILFGLVFHQKAVCVQHESMTVLSALILWISSNTDIGLITEKMETSCGIYYSPYKRSWDCHFVTCQNL